jgi:hypothetical protein
MAVLLISISMASAACSSGKGWAVNAGESTDRLASYARDCVFCPIRDTMGWGMQSFLGFAL